jgi:hypothetical protein
MDRECRRVWRLRKLHQVVDAQLCETPGEAGAELRFLVNGALSYARTHPTLEFAISEARARRTELEREGWMFHW